MKPGIQFLASGLALALAATPAVADVKAGVDAWSAGDFETAVREWRDLAEAGDPDAQFNLAQAYRLGRGVPMDLARAEMHYAKAAAQGHIQAADKYGILLFQVNKREAAMPYIEDAARRGDPQAQYLLGIAHFNGDLAPKDWPRAYALLTLANAAELPQAKGVLGQMDRHIPLEDRQRAQQLASQLGELAERRRARELAAVDLAIGNGELPYTAPTVPTAIPEPVRRVADATPRPSNDAATKRAAVSKRSGEWKVQLGSFAVAGNADRMWRQISAAPEIGGREKITTTSGRLTVLLAGGYSSKAEANAACSALKRKGHDCLVKR